MKELKKRGINWDKVNWNAITLAINSMFFLIFKALYLYYIIISVIIAGSWSIADSVINLEDKLPIQLYKPINYFIAFNVKIVAWAVVFIIIFYG